MASWRALPSHAQQGSAVSALWGVRRPLLDFGIGVNLDLDQQSVSCRMELPRQLPRHVTGREVRHSWLRRVCTVACLSPDPTRGPDQDQGPGQPQGKAEHARARRHGLAVCVRDPCATLPLLAHPSPPAPLALAGHAHAAPQDQPQHPPGPRRPEGVRSPVPEAAGSSCPSRAPVSCAVCFTRQLRPLCVTPAAALRCLSEGPVRCAGRSATSCRWRTPTASGSRPHGS
jgi:hypothetical protein